jgi:hypothetical protein
MNRLVLVIGYLAALGACTGDRGANGTDGTNGTNGTNGSDGQTVILSTRAKHGLDIAPVQLNLTGLTPAQIEQVGIGSYWVNAVIDCSGCHNSPTGGYLAGGNQFPIDASGDFVYSRNLTSDATGLKLTEAQFVEALQTGRDFHPDQNSGNGLLIVMPWNMFRWLHTSDLKAIYAYLKAIPAVSNQVTMDQKGAAGAATPIAFPTTFDRGETTRALTPETDFMGNPVPDPDGVIRGSEVNPLNSAALDATTEERFGRGSYLVNAAACNDCHTNPGFDRTPGPNFLKINTAQFLAGGGVFVTPPGLGPVFHTTRSMSANLLGHNGFFNESGVDFLLFEEILATGEHVDDPVPAPLAWPMPWDHFRNMDTEDLLAVYTYLGTLAAQQPRTDKLTQPPALFCDATHACPAGANFTCHTNATFGNECVGNTCTTAADCGACQHCTAGGAGTVCTAPDPANAADQACVNTGI